METLVNPNAEGGRVASEAPKTEARGHSHANKGGRRSGGLRGGAGAALNFQDLVAQVLPVAIAASTMVEDERRLSRVRIFVPGGQLPRLNPLGTMFSLILVRHGFLAS